MLSRGLQKGLKWTGWYHATVNLGDTGAIARRPEEFTQGSPREIGGRAIKAVMRQDAETAIALAKEALQMDPLEVGLWANDHRHRLTAQSMLRRATIT